MVGIAAILAAARDNAASPRSRPGELPHVYAVRLSVTDSLTIECPHCGETFAVAFDVSEGSARFTIDCEVCCRPMQLTIGVSEDGEIDSLTVEEE